MMNFHIYPAQLSDCEGILNVLMHNHKQFLEGADKGRTGFLVSTFDKEKLISWMHNENFKIVVAKNKENEIIGYMIGCSSPEARKENLFYYPLDWDIPEEKVFYHYQIALLKREKGMAASLLKAICDYAREKSFLVIMCIIYQKPFNEISHHFHTNQGFQKIDERENLDNTVIGIYSKKLFSVIV